MKDEKHSIPLYYFKRINQNRMYPIKKNPVFISSYGYYEFYMNEKLRIGAAKLRNNLAKNNLFDFYIFILKINYHD